jgi:hypothetical protein
MENLQDLIKFLKDKGLEHHKINIDLLCGIIEYFADKQLPKQCDIHVVVKSFTAEEVVNELKENETLDDAITFFNSQK